MKHQRLVGRYAIHGEIAAGGMATVHYGRLLGPVGFSRAVAVKRLHPQYAKDPEFVAMFLDEARLASRILHANVVSILDVVAEDGELFLVMEYVEGEVLSKLVRATSGPLPMPIAIAIAVGMLEGLHAAHEARDERDEAIAMVHRDVSPQNLLIGTDGVVRLIDFGVAKAVGNSRVTREGQIKGKISYMAPEQILSEPVDRRADVYSAAVVLWEILTGKRLFAGADNDIAVMRRAVQGVTEPPSAHRPEISAELDRVVLRGMARRPADRFDDARAMAQALEQLVTPAAARDVGLWVSSAAASSVRARAEKVREMEADSQIHSVAPPPLPPAPPPLSPPVAQKTKTEADLAPPVAPIAPAVPSEPAPRERTGRRTLITIVAVVLALLAGFYLARIMPGTDASTIPSATPSAPRDEASAATPKLEPTSTANVEPAPAASPSSAPEASTPHVAKPQPRSSAARPARPPSADCSPPYIVTPDGVREYKPNCLR